MGGFAFVVADILSFFSFSLGFGGYLSSFWICCKGEAAEGEI
jgi:hypothetical protein